MRAIFFPLGDTQSKIKNIPKRCLWREFVLLYSYIRASIQPQFKLQHILNRWADISVALQEPNRKRKRQLDIPP